MFVPLDFSKWAGEKLNQRISLQAAEEIEELGPRDDGESDVDLFVEVARGLSVYLTDPETLPQDPLQLDPIITRLRFLKLMVEEMPRGVLGDDEDIDTIQSNIDILLKLAQNKRKLVE